MRDTTPNVINEFWDRYVKMSILINIFVIYFFARVIKFTNISSCKLKLLLEKLWKFL